MGSSAKNQAHPEPGKDGGETGPLEVEHYTPAPAPESQRKPEGESQSHVSAPPLSRHAVRTHRPAPSPHHGTPPRLLRGK